MQTATLLALGATLRFQGYDYRVHAIEDIRGETVVSFRRRPEHGDGDTPFRYCRGNAATLRDSGEGWLYFEGMVLGKLPYRVQQAVATGGLDAEAGDTVLRAIRVNPRLTLFGRDDLAARDVLTALSLPADLLDEHHPWPSKLPSDALPPMKGAGDVEEQLRAEG